MKLKKNKFLSFALMLAVSATAVGASALAACGSSNHSSADKEDIAKVTGTTYYVSTTGKSDADGTESDPYDIYTLLHNESGTNSILQPGDTVLVQPGVYNLSNRIIMAYSGNYKNPITIKNADPSQEAVLSFYEMEFDSINRGVQIYGNYFLWDSIDIRGAGDNGMYIGGSYNTVINCEFYDNRDTGLQLGRSISDYTDIVNWPSYNLIKNCTSYNNYDNETYGENADGFAAKLTVGYHNVFDGCIAYRNSDDGWDLYAKSESGNIGCVIMYNCVAFENGYINETQAEFNAKFPTYNHTLYDEANTASFVTRDGDGNGFKLGGGTMEGDVILDNCLSFNNRMHGVTDNSNPGVLSIKNVTSYNNSAILDTRSHLDITDTNGNTSDFYHAIGSSGYILYSSGATAIIDEEGKTLGAKSYAALDSDGYILNSDNKYYTTDGKEFDENNAGTANDLRVKGSYAVAGENQTVNSEFGYVDVTGETSDSCNNIDIERDDNSYNNFANVLSVWTNKSLGSDQYRGSGEYSILVQNASTWTKIEESVDADYLNNLGGASISAISETDLFAALPAKNLGMSSDIHETYRNADGSINMGDLLRIKDYSLLFGDEHKIGADLSKSSWDEYEHYSQTDLTTFKTVEKSVLAAISDSLYIPANVEHVYQDFNVLTTLYGAEVVWSSSDSNVLTVTEVYGPTPSLSKVEYVKIAVYRPENADQTVTLTATINYKGKTLKKSFDINVAKAAYKIGDIVAEGAENDKFITSLYDSSFTEPDLIVYDGSDYNGKTLAKKLYTEETTYQYAEDLNSTFSPRLEFSVFDGGVYKISKTVTLLSTNEQKNYEYTIYVVDPDGNVDFVGTPTVSVNKVGYVISGNLSNVSGTLYSMVSDTQPTGEELKANGNAYAFRADSILSQVEQDNSAGYTVYYAIFNPNGALTSNIYSTEVEQVSITTCAEFQQLAISGGEANKIYLLANDLDFTGYSWSTSNAQGFVGLLDGQGHTVKGITMSGTSDGGVAVFSSLKGGTIMNINFEDISLTNTGTKVGIIAQAYGGYLYNIHMKNIYATGSQRVAALVGQVLEASTPLYIDRISLVNTKADAIIFASSQRAGGIVGLIQPSSAPVYNVNVQISNCYVNAVIGKQTAGQSGGIVATFDTQKVTISHYLSITNCYFAGTVKANSRSGGILGYQQGTGTLRISNCVSYGDIYHATGADPIVVAEKNSSGIMGGFVAAADCIITNCYAKIAEYNTEYGVTVIHSAHVTMTNFWSGSNWANFDMENLWEYVYDGTTLTAPYIQLR